MTPIILGTDDDAIILNLALVRWIRVSPAAATVHFHRQPDLVITDPTQIAAILARAADLIAITSTEDPGETTP